MLTFTVIALKGWFRLDVRSCWGGIPYCAPVRYVVRGNVEAKVLAFSYREGLEKGEIQVPRSRVRTLARSGWGVAGNERIRVAAVLRAGYCEAAIVDPVRRRALKALRRIADQIGSLIEEARSRPRRR